MLYVIVSILTKFSQIHRNIELWFKRYIMSYNYHDISRQLSPLLNYTDSDYIPKPYDVPQTIISTHNQPRYGHTNDFASVIDKNKQETMDDYIVGIIIGAIIILAVALVWFSVIIILKILGEKKVGFFAGRLVAKKEEVSLSEGDKVEVCDNDVIPPPEEQQQEDDIEEKRDTAEQPLNWSTDNKEQVGDENEVINEAIPVGMNNTATDSDKQFNRRVWSVRIIFVLSGSFVMIAGGLFYGKGVTSFKNSIDGVRVGIDLVQVAAYKGISLTEGLMTGRDEINEDVESTEEVKEGNGGEICGLDTDISDQIRTVYDEFVVNVDELTDMLDGTLEGFTHDLTRLIELTQQVDDSLDQADIFFYILIAISAIIICIIMAMLVGVFMAYKGWQNCLTTCVKNALIWPLFIFFLILSWLFATLFLVASLAGADFCFSPDEYVQTILTQNEDTFDGIIFGFITYYVSGCKVEPLGVQDLEDLAAHAQTVNRSAHAMLEVLGKTSIQSLTALCGLTTAQATALKALVELAHEATHVLNRGAVGLRDLLECETFNPIYNTFVHDAFCSQGVSGLTYIFSTTLVISVFSMIMIMFRAALYPVVEATDQLEGKDNAKKNDAVGEDSNKNLDLNEEKVEGEGLNTQAGETE